MSPHIAADDDMAKTFIATFRAAGTREILT